jgi:RHS repeat-associated protein
MFKNRQISRSYRKGHESTATNDDSITKYARNAQAQRVFKTAPLFAVTNPDPAAPQSTLDAFTAFFESLWSPTTTATEKAGMSYVYDETGTLIADTLAGGASTTWGQSARYIYLPTASGPMPVAAIYGTKHYAVQSDHLNTPRRLIQSDGQVAWQWSYSAFGEEQPTIAKNRFANTSLNQSFGTTTVPAVTFNLRYPGQYFDQESGLHYNLNRSYDSGRGRYTQADPIDLKGGWNRFGYVDANPLSFVDPSGLRQIRPSLPTPIQPQLPYMPPRPSGPQPVPNWQNTPNVPNNGFGNDIADTVGAITGGGNVGRHPSVPSVWETGLDPLRKDPIYPAYFPTGCYPMPEPVMCSPMPKPRVYCGPIFQ